MTIKKLSSVYKFRVDRATEYSDVEKCQTEGFYWQNFIRTDKKLIFLLHILLFGLARFSKSVQMTVMSKKISTSMEYKHIFYISPRPFMEDLTMLTLILKGRLLTPDPKCYMGVPRINEDK